MKKKQKHLNRKNMNKENWKTILKIVVAVATALLGVFGANAAMGVF